MKIIYNNILKKICRLNTYMTIYKGVSMNNYKIDDETTKKVLSSYNNAKDAGDIDKLIKQINQANETFCVVELPEYEEPSLERLEQIELNEDDIRKQAENSLLEYKNSSVSKIESDVKEKENMLNQNLEDLDKSKEESKVEIANYYDNIREISSNDALKRGLARSSIVINQLDAFNNDELNTYKALEKDYNEKIDEINFELNSLNQQKEQALADFDIAYAVKLNDQINTLTNSLLEKQTEIIKYNNEISEKEKDYKDKYNSFITDIKEKNINKDIDIAELIAKYGEKVISGYKNNQINNLVDSYFKNMSKEDILNILNTNEELRKALGSKLDSIIQRYQ